MAKLFTIPYRRKRVSRTDYKKRLALLKSRKPRLVIRRSNKNMLAQLIKYSDDGDIVLATVRSNDLKKYGWDLNCGNIPAAYLTGLLIGVKAKGQEAIADIGLQTPKKGSRIFAVLKGAIDGGLKVPLSEEVLPNDDRITGKHIIDYGNHLKANKNVYDKYYSAYLKNKKEPEKMHEYFKKTKEAILSGN